MARYDAIGDGTRSVFNLYYKICITSSCRRYTGVVVHHTEHGPTLLALYI